MTRLIPRYQQSGTVYERSYRRNLVNLPFLKTAPAAPAGTDSRQQERGEIGPQSDKTTKSRNTLIAVAKQCRRAARKTGGPAMLGHDRTLPDVTNCTRMLRKIFCGPLAWHGSLLMEATSEGPEH